MAPVEWGGVARVTWLCNCGVAPARQAATTGASWCMIARPWHLHRVDRSLLSAVIPSASQHCMTPAAIVPQTPRWEGTQPTSPHAKLPAQPVDRHTPGHTGTLSGRPLFPAAARTAPSLNPIQSGRAAPEPGHDPDSRSSQAGFYPHTSHAIMRTFLPWPQPARWNS